MEGKDRTEPYGLLQSLETKIEVLEQVVGW